MAHGTRPPTVTTAPQPPPMFVWVAFGHPDNPPDRIKVESCRDCFALIPAANFDEHGQFHARVNKALGVDL